MWYAPPHHSSLASPFTRDEIDKRLGNTEKRSEGIQESRDGISSGSKVALEGRQ